MLYLNRTKCYYSILDSRQALEAKAVLYEKMAKGEIKGNKGTLKMVPCCHCPSCMSIMFKHSKKFNLILILLYFCMTPQATGL